MLDALALLLSPSNSTTISETDYWQRNTDAEFVIRATVSIPAAAEIENQKSMVYPWNWNGTEAVLPRQWRQYQYPQTSYRVGKKVRTRSKYLGIGRRAAILRTYSSVR